MTRSDLVSQSPAKRIPPSLGMWPSSTPPASVQVRITLLRRCSWYAHPIGPHRSSIHPRRESRPLPGITSQVSRSPWPCPLYRSLPEGMGGTSPSRSERGRASRLGLDSTSCLAPVWESRSEVCTGMRRAADRRRERSRLSRLLLGRLASWCSCCCLLYRFKIEKTLRKARYPRRTPRLIHTACSSAPMISCFG